MFQLQVQLEAAVQDKNAFEISASSLSQRVSQQQEKLNSLMDQLQQVETHINMIV